MTILLDRWRLLGLSLLIVAISPWYNLVEAQLTPVVTAAPPIAACSGNARNLVGLGATYAVNGTALYVHPALADGTFASEPKMALSILNITEQLRGSTVETSCDIDNSVVAELDLSTCSCLFSDFISESSEWRDQGVQFNFSDCPGHENLTIHMYFAIPDKDHTDIYEATMPGSTNETFAYFHPSGGVKVGLILRNWNWSAEYLEQDTYLGIKFSFLMKPLISGVINRTLSYDMVRFDLRVDDFDYLLRMERGMIFDGIPSVSGNQSRTGQHSPFSAIGDYWVGADHVQGFCTSRYYPYQKWSMIEYDPSLVAVLADFPQPTDGPAAPQSKAAAWIVPVAVSVPIVVAIVIIVILLVVFVPSVQNFVRPFAKKGRPAKSLDPPHHADSHSTSKTWQAANKPQN